MLSKRGEAGKGKLLKINRTHEEAENARMKREEAI